MPFITGTKIHRAAASASASSELVPLTTENIRALDSEIRKRPRQFQRASSYSPRENLLPLTDEDGAMERCVRMDIMNTDMI